MSSLINMMGKILDKFDFWSIRDPGQLDSRGLPRPGEALRGLKGCRLLGELSTSDPTISSAVRMVRNMLFDYRRWDQPQFTVECSNVKLHDLIKTEFLDERGDDNRFGYGIYHLDDFLRSMASQMMVYGRSYIRITWEQTNGTDNSWYIKRFTWMFPGDIKPIKEKGDTVAFNWWHRKEEFNNQSPIIAEKVATEDVIESYWIFDRDKEAGESPLKRVIKYYWEDIGYHTATLAYMYSWANLNDKRFWVERARNLNLKAALEKQRRRRLLMAKELGVPEMYPPPPMTDYYDVYYFLKFRRRLAQVREYLLAQFNAQAVRRFAAKNGFTDEVRIVAVKYLSVREIDSLLNRFTAGEITKEEVLKSFD